MKKILDKFRLGHHEFENGHLDDIEGVDPYDLFEIWVTEATENNEREPNAFALSTSDALGQPSSRIVYLKDIIEGQFIFYTNYASRKGEDILANPKVSMLFFWPEASRQIRILGECTQVSSDVSDAYFASRPRGSQIGAWASNQSEELLNRQDLEDRVGEFESRFPEEVPRPNHWGGYQINPTAFEFWQGRPSRLHDRIVFEKEEGKWSIKKLNP